jgi:peptidoglycan hydrolase CwlO-like protein
VAESRLGTYHVGLCDPTRVDPESRPSERIHVDRVRKDRMRHGGAFVLRMSACALVFTLLSATVAYATPSAITEPSTSADQTFRTELQKRQAELNLLESQLSDLDQQAEIASEAYNLALQTLTETQTNLSATRAELTAAESALDTQTALLADRVDSLYRDDGTTNAEVLLSAKSLGDFFSRIQSIMTISEADAGLATQLSSQRDQIESKQLDLEKADMLASSLEFTLKARKVEIEYQIADRQKMLKSAQSGLIGILDTESKRRMAQEMGLWRSIVSGAQDIGVTVEPGSPVETALAYHGIPYLWGGASPAGFDCSGLTMYVMAQHGVVLPHHAASQYLMGVKVDPGNLQPGDLVFFGSPVHHVGMYIGGGYFVEAPHTGDYVKVSKLAGRTDYVGARRYAWRYRVDPPLGVRS